MSDQTINIRTVDTMLCDNDKILLKYADQHFLKKRFALGKYPDYKKASRLIRMNRLLCSDNCEIEEYVTKYIINEQNCNV